MLQVNRLLVHILVVLQLVLYFLNSTRLVMVKLTCFSSDTCWQQIRNNVTPPLFEGCIYIYTIATFDDIFDGISPCYPNHDPQLYHMKYPILYKSLWLVGWLHPMNSPKN